MMKDDKVHYDLSPFDPLIPEGVFLALEIERGGEGMGFFRGILFFSAAALVPLIVGGLGERIPTVGPGTTAYLHATYQSPYHGTSGFNLREGLSSFLGKDEFRETCSKEMEPRCTEHRRRGLPEFRTFDGSCNSRRFPSRGKARTPYVRALPPSQSFDNFQCGNRDRTLPTPRSVSLRLVRRGDHDRHSRLSMYLMLWGQLIDHDLLVTPPRMTDKGDFVDCCHRMNSLHPDCCPILSRSDDPFYSRNNRPKCQSVIRSRLVPKRKERGCGGELDVENSNSAWMDASFLYGSSKERADLLRTFRNGQLKISVDRFNRVFPPLSKAKKKSMEFGDNRGDSHLAFTMINTAFIRFHNRLAIRLRRLNRDWNDERVYQEARKIVGAIVQHFTYSEFVPRLLGRRTPIHVPYTENHRDYYDPNVDGSVGLEFGTAGFRLHSFISSWYNLVGTDGRIKSKLHLRNLFRSPMGLLNGTVYDDIMRGMATQPLRRFNNIYTPEMTEWMLRKGTNDFGFDIVAITIQRGRDHRLRGYTAYRQRCGLGRVRNWNDLADLIAPNVIRRLRSTYRRVEDVDLDIGLVLESPLPGTQVSPTAKCLIEDQLLRTRNGDRFFYTRPGVFSSRQLKAIKSFCLSDILCEGADDSSRMTLPDNSFLSNVDRNNPRIPCSRRKRFDVRAWRSR